MPTPACDHCGRRLPLAPNGVLCHDCVNDTEALSDYYKASQLKFYLAARPELLDVGEEAQSRAYQAHLERERKRTQTPDEEAEAEEALGRIVDSMRVEEEVQHALAEAGVREDPKECLFCRKLTTSYVTSRIRDNNGIWRSEYRPFCRQSNHLCSVMYDVTQRTQRTQYGCHE